MNIGIVNDSPTALEAIRRVLASAPQHEVAWMAHDGKAAVAQCQRQKPDLILMDLLMPKMDGVEATRQIMAATPCPILIVTASVDANSPKVFAALSAGAMDAVKTPVLTGDLRFNGETLLAKIEMIRMLLWDISKPPAKRTMSPSRNSNWLLAVGASAGGPAALAEVLREIPADCPASVIVVQHIDEQFAKPLAEWLNSQSGLPVRVARRGDSPQPGHVLLAQTNDHLIFTSPTTLDYTPDPASASYRPSVDVFFQSAAKFWRGSGIGVLLTGMGRDGARGLKTLREKGWHTIAQDSGSSVVYGMPKAAVEMNAASHVLPLRRIAAAIASMILKTN